MESVDQIKSISLMTKLLIAIAMHREKLDLGAHHNIIRRTYMVDETPKDLQSPTYCQSRQNI